VITTLYLIGWIVTGIVALVRIRMLRKSLRYSQDVSNQYFAKYREADDQRYKAYKMVDEQRQDIERLSAEVKQQGNR
jgi:hypothetical protein